MLLQLPTAAVSSPLTPPSTDWLACTGLCLRRHGIDLLDRVNLRCRSGEWLVLVDPVGDSGSALLAAIEGRARVDAGALQWPRGVRPALASVLGNLRWPPGLTPRQITASLGLLLTGDQLAGHGLERRLDWPLAELSPLESRLLQLLIASAGPAQTLLLDDPLRDLDGAARAVFVAAISALRARWPQALWKVADVADLQRCCERRVDLDRGRICQDRRFGEGAAQPAAGRVDRSFDPLARDASRSASGSRGLAGPAIARFG